MPSYLPGAIAFAKTSLPQLAMGEPDKKYYLMLTISLRAYLEAACWISNEVLAFLSMMSRACSDADSTTTGGGSA